MDNVLKSRRFWYTTYFTSLHIDVKECVVSHYFFFIMLIMTKSISTSRTAPKCENKKCDGYSFRWLFNFYLYTSRSPTNMKCNTRMCDKYVYKKVKDQMYMFKNLELRNIIVTLGCAYMSFMNVFFNVKIQKNKN